MTAAGVQGRLLDVQWQTPHLATLGAVEIPRREYLRRLSVALERPLPPVFGTESPRVDAYIARTRPTGWTGDGARHDCYAEWGRRSSGRFRGLVAFAGTTEYRAGDRVTDARPRPSFTP